MVNFFSIYLNRRVFIMNYTCPKLKIYIYNYIICLKLCRMSGKQLRLWLDAASKQGLQYLHTPVFPNTCYPIRRVITGIDWTALWFSYPIIVIRDKQGVQWWVSLLSITLTIIFQSDLRRKDDSFLSLFQKASYRCSNLGPLLGPTCGFPLFLFYIIKSSVAHY